MGKYNGAVITAAGQNLIAQAIAESKTVTFTTAQASSHVYPSSTNFEALTALTDVEKTVDINYAGVYSDTTIQISARFDNDGVDTAFLINTLGFFAQLGTDAPILFAVSTAVTPDQMPVFDADNPSAFIYNMQITVQNADSVTVTVNPAGTVTTEQLNIITNDIYGKIGNLANLTTNNKTSLVNAVNEVNSHADIVQAQVSNSGDTYSSSKAYVVGDLVIYNNVLYRCITACSAGSWATNQSCFTADTLVNAIDDTALKLISDDISNNFSTSGSYIKLYANKNKVILSVLIILVNPVGKNVSSLIGRIPSSFRPAIQKKVPVTITTSNVDFITSFNIDPSTGDITVLNTSSGTSKLYISCNIEYFR